MLKETFLNKLKQRYHDNFSKYDYSLVPNEFVYNEKIKINCKSHGIFEQRSSCHLRGKGCRKCHSDYISVKFSSNTQEFINKANLKHNHKYNYSKVKYVNAFTKVIITCPIHGDFLQTPGNHLYGFTCFKCSYLDRTKNLRHTTEQFIEKAKLIHGDKYDYSKTIYTKAINKVVITCLKHGVFEQYPNTHLNGSGCSICSRENISIKLRGPRVLPEGFVYKPRISNHYFINIARKKHNNKYNYDKVNYTNSKDKVTITCPLHGDFKQSPSSHLLGNGCPICGKYAQRHTSEYFIDNANKVHNNKYDYSLVNYKNSRTVVSIICKLHGIFNQKPTKHIQGRGCPRCSESKGEIYISQILEKYNIKYIPQYRIDSYKYRYDFYLSDYNIYIEYHGEQHYIPVKHFGGIKGFKKSQRRDKIKKELIKRSSGILIIIKYTFKTLEQIESELLRLFTIIHPKFLIDKDVVKVYITDSNIYLINNGIAYKRKSLL